MSAKTKRKDVTDLFLSDTRNFNIKDIKFTTKQRELNKILKDAKVVFISGVAGTSKTYCSVFGALMALKSGSKDKIKYLRAAVESSQSKMGFLPGDINDKISPFCVALHDKLHELLNVSDANYLLQKGAIECGALNFLRGVTFSDSFIIIDEAQQLPKKDLITILSRIGENTTLVFCYDPMQADIRNSGIEDVAKIFDDQESRDNGIFTFAFTADDVLRSGVLRFIMQKLEKKE